MYIPSKENKNELLNSNPDTPTLVATDPFRCLIETLPDGCEIPISLIKLGLLTEHLEPKRKDVITDQSAIDVDTTASVALLSKTLAAVEWLLYNHCGDLDGSRKKQIGRLCEVAGLNKQNERGISETAVRDMLPGSYDQHPTAMIQEITPEYECKYCSRGFDSVLTRDSHLENCDERPSSSDTGPTSSSSRESSRDSRPALGKEIQKDKGSERLSGRNPFADADRLKDTGLHQGGGS